MKKLGLFAFLLLAWLLILASSFFSPNQAQADSITVWPDQLKPLHSGDVYYQSVDYVGCSTSDNNRRCEFFMPVTLPEGHCIAGVTYFHLGHGVGADSSIILHSHKVGEKFQRSVAYGSSTDDSGEVFTVDAPITGNPMVQKGYRYFIEISVNPSAFFLGAKIYYFECSSPAPGK